MIKYFSHKHKLHLLLTFEYERACFTLRHLMLYIILLSSRLQIYIYEKMLKLWQGSTIELTPHFEITPKTYTLV